MYSAARRHDFDDFTGFDDAFTIGAIDLASYNDDPRATQVWDTIDERVVCPELLAGRWSTEPFFTRHS